MVHRSTNASCSSLTKWFKNNSQWADSGYADLAAGDLIFFDWDLDEAPNHVGMVIGRSGSTVYTVDGNSGDTVRINTYDVGSNVIHGYGLMNNKQ